MDEKDLKIKVLVQRLATTTAGYEEQDADRRVQIAILNQTVNELKKKLQKEREKIDDSEEKE